MSQSLVGQTLLGKYRVDGVIGSGGMGTVYDACDLRLGRQVAIKVLSANASGFGDMGRRFRREARAIAKITHPNLVTLLEYDVLDDGTPAMVMEKVEGTNLRWMLAQHRFTVAEAHRVLWQALAALAVCHDHGYVHRDLKPDNVLVETGADGLNVKLIDFGLTKLISEDGATALTLNGEVFGSPRFMAPEQWFRQAVDGRTDLYALGCLGYCMLLGHHFIPPGNPIAVCQAHMQGERPALTHAVGGEPIPVELAAALRQAVEPDMQRRWPDARAMIHGMAGEASAPLPPPPIEPDAFDDNDTDVITGGELMAGLFNAGVVESDATLFETRSDGASLPPTEVLAIDQTLLDGGNLAARVAAATSAPPLASAPTPTPHPPRERLQRISGDALQQVLRATEERDVVRNTSLDLAAQLPDLPSRRGSERAGWVVPVVTGALVGVSLLVWLFLTR